MPSSSSWSSTGSDARPRVPFSFELFPPRSASGQLPLFETIDMLAAARPEFISVTYGAGGSSRTSSLEVLRYIREQTTIEPLAHLTCVGSTHVEANRLVREFLDAGITSFLALRGDPPAGSGEDDDFLGDIGSAGELVQLIHRVQAERVPYGEVLVPGLPNARHVDPERKRVAVAVAAFPNGHPRSRSSSQDIDTLLAKEAAGATFAITQLFFHASDFLRFVDRARAAGVTMPILPGIMPITSPQRLARILELTGEEHPSELEIALEVEPTDQGRREIGIEHAVALTESLLAGGAPGIHLYAFNRHDTVLSVLEGSGIIETTPSTPERV